MAPLRKTAAIYLSKVPSVKELCEKLGFQRASTRETSVFTDTTHAFRKSYLSCNGRRGIELTNWNEAIIQQELTLMANMFLDEGDNGERFWSESRPWKEEGDILFPEDRIIIADLLKQLFWKQNKYSLNNQLYGEKKNDESSNQSRENTISARGSVAGLSTSPHSSFDTSQRTFSKPKVPLTATQPRGPVISLLDDESSDGGGEAEKSHGHTEARRTDIFEFPGEDREEETSGKRLEADKRPMQLGKRNIHSSTLEDKTPQIRKKAKSNPVPSEKDQKIKSKIKRAYRKRSSQGGPKRSSGRPKKARKLPDAVPDAVLDTILRTDDEIELTADQQDQRQNPLRRTANVLSLAEPNIPHDIQQKFSNFLPGTLTGKFPSRGDDAVSSSTAGPSQAFRIPAVPMRASVSQSTWPQQPQISSMSPCVSHPTLSNATSPNITSFPAPKPKPKLHGRIFIVTSPEPNYSFELWENGQIKGKPLPTVIDEISCITRRDGIEKLRIKLKTSFAQMTETVHRDSEEWEFTKATIDEMIRDAFLRDREQLIHFRIWIEPLYRDITMSGGAGPVEEEDINW